MPSNETTPNFPYRAHAQAMAQDLAQLKHAADRCISDIEGIGNQYYSGPEAERPAWEATWNERESAERDLLLHYISTLAIRMVIYADAMQLKSIAQLVSQWRERWPESTWRATKRWSTPEADGIYSEPLSSLSPILDGLMVLASPSDAAPPDVALRRSQEHLEHGLRSLPKICRERGVVPRSENDIQRVLHSHLEGIFPDYIRNPAIPKPLVSFKPDGGVASMKSAIECKFIDSETDLRTAVHGLTEDLAGYAGSSDWTRFYTLCYMTAAFAVEGQLQAALGASGMAGSWKVIMVTGAGSRPR